MKKRLLLFLLCSCLSTASLLYGCSKEDKTAATKKENGTETRQPETDEIDYEAYLDWTEEAYTAAAQEDKENAARAYMVYSAQKGGNNVSMADVDQVPDDMLPEVMAQMEQFYEQAEDGKTIKQILDDNYAAASNLNMDLAAVDLGEYEKYLEYTDQDYLTASDADKQNVLTAYYLAVTGTNAADVDVNNLGMDFETLDSSLSQLFAGMPGMSVRKILEAAIEMFQ